MEPMSKLSKNLKRALEIANKTTWARGATYVGSEHIVYGFLCEKGCVAETLLTAAGVKKEEYEASFFLTINADSPIEGMTDRTKQMFRLALKFGEETKMPTGTAHMLYAILESDTCYAYKILRKLGVDVAALKDRALFALKDASQAEETGDIEPSDGETFGTTGTASSSQTGTETGSEETKRKAAPQRTKSGLFDKKETSKTATKLSPYGIDVTERAKKGKLDPVIGRKKEIEKVVQVLSRRSKNNPVLIGEPGVGKSAIAEGLAQLIVEGDVPEQLYNKTVFSVDIPGMLAGARYRGDFEERLKDLVDTVLEDGDVVLFIDEIHTIVGAGASAESGMDAANILKPMLARGDLQVIGATTVEEYRKYIEKDAALERRFTPVFVEEPSINDAIEILKGLRPKYEQHHGIVISDDAIESAVKLSSRYITDRFLPDKAIDLIDEAAAHARIVTGGANGGEVEEIERLEYEIKRMQSEELRFKAAGEYANADKAFKERVAAAERLNGLRRAQELRRLPDGRYELGKEQVAAIVSARMRIPLLKITQEEGEKLMRLEEDLHKRIVGQNEGVAAVAKAIRRARAGLKDPSRPIGSFIFVGPTGVGKTDLCKALAEAMFGSEDQMIRLDMSEYMEKQSVSKLIGAPPGYAGYDDMGSGQLTDKVRTKPYCVVLFDEIEKAHPDVFNLLLQILDDGRLTDSKGRTVSFKNAVVILTSNIGAVEAREEKTGVYGFGSELSGQASPSQTGFGVGFGGENKASSARVKEAEERKYEGMKERIGKALKERFRPEFLNRLDDVIVFRPLTEEDCAKIGAKIVEGLAKRLQEQRGVYLCVTSSALKILVKEGYDPEFGARPLKRVIQRRIEDKLSEEILLGRIVGGDKVTVDERSGELRFIKE